MSGAANVDAGTRSLGLRTLNPSSALSAFVVGAAAALCIGLLQGQKPFYYDSGIYWALSESFAPEGHFSLFNFGNPIRGYALPLVYFAIRNVGELATDTPGSTVIAFNSLLFSAIGTVLLPRLAEVTWPDLRWSAPRRLALLALMLLFWRGYLSYPLSDFPALAAGLLAIIAISSPRAPAWMGVAGLSAAAAFEFRPAYIMLFPILLGLALWGLRSESPSRRVLCLALFSVGATVVMLPQSLVEHHRVGGYSPLPGGSELAGLQYTEGLKLQRYDTFVGGTPEHASMRYIDPHTKDLLESLEGEEVESTGKYAELALRNPVTMSGVFLRHVVNGLDQRYRGPYVERLHPPFEQTWRAAGFLIVFLALLRILWGPARRALGGARWAYPAALLMASATSIASAVEARFLLPVFALCATVLLAPGWTGPLRQGIEERRYRDLAAAVVAGAAYVALVLWIVHGATTHLHFGGASG